MHIAIYKITNLTTGKAYIGLTKNPDRRFREHFTESRQLSIGGAIRKYGHEGFSFEVIAWALSYEDACFLEQELISQWSTLSPLGYNLTTGGEGGKEFSDETRARIAASQRGNTKRRGAVLSAETKAKISASRAGIFQTEEVRRQQGRARRGNTNAMACSVQQITRGLVVAEFRSIKQASEKTGIHRTAINRACKRTDYTAGGYSWQYQQQQ